MAANTAASQSYPAHSASATNGAARSPGPPPDTAGHPPQATSPSDIYADYGRGEAPINLLGHSVYAGLQPEEDALPAGAARATDPYPHFGSPQTGYHASTAPQTPTHMYPVNQASRFNNHQAMKPSIDGDVAEALQQSPGNESTHSRARLNGLTPQTQHRARFDSVNGFPTAKPQIGGHVQPTDFAEKTGAEKETRNLPAGYSTPPSFSRASSGWSNFGMSSKKGQQTGRHPYGNLGAAASVSDPALQFAQGDYANSKFARAWLALLSKNIVIRWLVYIVPITALLWIPGEYSHVKRVV